MALTQKQREKLARERFGESLQGSWINSILFYYWKN